MTVFGPARFARTEIVLKESLDHSANRTALARMEECAIRGLEIVCVQLILKALTAKKVQLGFF